LTKLKAHFLNAFGAGRSEASIGGLSSKKLNYSLRTIQPISELDANSKALTFIQASIASAFGNLITQLVGIA
jgi:hypothetical protein